MYRSPFVRHAIELRDRVRAQYDDHVHAQYLAAEQACRTKLLNDRGERAGIDSYSLFSGPAARAKAYASPELIEWWASHPRVTFEDFERQMFASWQHTGMI